MAKHNKSLPFVFIIYVTAFLCIIKVGAGGCFWSSGWFINVCNLIPNEKVLVHCKSKDNDIGGVQTIGWNESVHWQFCENIVSPSTLYFCHIWWGNSEQVFDVFNGQLKRQCIEKEKKDYWRCTWLIKKDGFYLIDRTNGGHNDVKKYDWKPIGSA
ncbi:hypothetical protein Lser_V15G02802 [Lactuca serriola]